MNGDLNLNLKQKTYGGIVRHTVMGIGIGHNGISIEDVRLNCGTVGYNGGMQCQKLMG